MRYDNRATDELNEMLIQVRAARGNPPRRPHAVGVSKSFPDADTVVEVMIKNREYAMAVKHDENQLLIETTSDNS
jgi:hypothetical protein